MAVTQYVGARYVPVFADPAEWTNTKQYEPLTIVLHQGNSFTSRQFVPVGIDIDNTDYWAETGNYNAQVETYRQEVIDLQESWVDWKTDTQDDLESWETELQESWVNWKTDTQDDLESWKTDTVSDFETAIGNVPNIIPSSAFTPQNTVKKYIDNFGRGTTWHGKNVLCITDSWGSEGNHGVTTCWMRRVCNTLGANYIDLHQGSTGFYYPPQPQSGFKNFPTRLQEYIASKSRDELSEIDYVILSGSTNDAYAPNGGDIQSGIETCVQRIRNNMPNAIIILVPQIASPLMLSGSSANNKNIWSYVNGAAGVFATFNRLDKTIVVTSSAYWLYTSRHADALLLMNSDNIHPTQAGHDLIAKRFISCVVMGQPFSLHLDIRNRLRIGIGTDFNAQLIKPQYVYASMDIEENVLRLRGQVTIDIATLGTTGSAYMGIEQFVNCTNDPWIYGEFNSNNACIGIGTLFDNSNNISSCVIFGRSGMTAGTHEGNSNELYVPLWRIVQNRAFSSFASNPTLNFEIEQRLTYVSR